MPAPETDLGAAELEVLRTLWDEGPTTVREVMNLLHRRGRKVAYTTVLTFLSRLEAKGCVKSDRSGVAYVYRAHPALMEMKQALDHGRFGRPLQVVAVSGQNFPFYRPAYRQTYYADRATGGGAIQDALTHVVNAAEWLVGGPVAGVEA